MIFTENGIWARRLFPKLYIWNYYCMASSDTPRKDLYTLQAKRGAQHQPCACVKMQACAWPQASAGIVVLPLQPCLWILSLAQDWVLLSVIWSGTNRNEHYIACSACRQFESIYFQAKLGILSLSCRWQYGKGSTSLCVGHKHLFTPPCKASKGTGQYMRATISFRLVPCPLQKTC